MRKLALTLGVVTAIVGIWVMIQAGRSDDAPVGFEEGVPSGSSTAETMQSGEEPAAEESVEVTNPGLARSEVERVETGAEERSPLLRILVVDKETGARVPGAEVAWR